MKTIKELEAEINLNKNFDLNNWKEDKTFDVGYREALKDVLGLIDEVLGQCLKPLMVEPYNVPLIVIYNCKEELKKRING